MQMESTCPLIVLPIFCGQGPLSSDTEEPSRRIRQLASSPTSIVLLEACFEAFQAELQTLPMEMVEQVGICVDDFKDKSSLLCPTREEYLSNPIISGSTLLLLQVSRYLHHVERSTASRNDNQLDSLLLSNAHHGIGVLGYSSGILTAAVVAASRSKLDLIRHAVEAYRLAFWIGLRSQLFWLSCNSNSSSVGNFQDSRPWSLVISSPDLSFVRQALISFNEESQRVFITSVIDDHLVTISGQPNDLANFKLCLPTGTQISETNIGCLYHVPSKLESVREDVLKDVASRTIRFPTFQDLVVPLRSSFDGEIVNGTFDGQPLVQLIVDMVLIRPVNWEMVVRSTVASIPCNVKVELLSIGMDKTFLKGLEDSLSCNGISDFRYSELDHESDRLTGSGDQVPIAIVGMSVRTPGAETVDELWNILTQGLNTLEVIPADRFDFSYYCNGENPGRKMTANTGNFVHGIGEFDHKFFGISPREAESLDPQQKLLLHVGYEALENAGYVPDSTPTFAMESFGCFIGTAGHDYSHNLRNDIGLYYLTGTLISFLSGRLSYCLGFSGPSIVVDTSCSSSLIAIYQAVRALTNGDCKAALAGGVNVICSPEAFLGLDNAHFLSPSGGCKSFDASADGYSRSDGCGIFVLKRLCNAIEENDRILGVIRGIEVNQSGQARSITHPHSPTLEALFTRVVKRSGVKAHAVNYIEAHAPGTQAGDVNELSSLRQVFATGRLANNPLLIGSIKANIGHLEAASGAASLAKVLLMMYHKTIPAQISLKTLNPAIPPLDVDNTRISTTNVPWVTSTVGGRRLALVNNFGATGSNAATVVEEYISTPTQHHSTGISTYVFGLSAKDDSSLGRLRTNLMKWLEVNGKEVSLADLSYTLMARRQVYACRLVVTASTVEGLIDHLNGAMPVHVAHTPNMPVVFVFSGQGGHYHGMGSSLYQSSLLFKKHIDECDSILCGLGFPSILAIIAGDGANTYDEEATHTAVFALEYALAKVWMSWGIRPVALVGHSLGEYAALVIGGTLQLRDALIIIGTRARLMFERCAHKATGMLAVALAPVILQGILESPRWSGLSISGYNSPHACVVAGPLSKLTEFKHFFESACKCTLLDLPFGFHSPAMAAVYDELISLGGKVRTRPPSIPIVSTVFGRVCLPGDTSFGSQDYFAKHCSDPVRFTDAIGAYLSCPTLGGVSTVWFEIGPHPSVLPMLQSFRSLEQSTFVSSLHKKQDSWAATSKALASFYLTHTVDWRSVFMQTGPVSVISLPSYPFSRDKHWIPFREGGVEFGDCKSKYTASTTSTDPSGSNDSPTIPCISQSTIVGIIARNCNIPVNDISPQHELDSLGIDSLMRLALRHDLASTFPHIRLSPYEVSACQFVRELVDLVLKSLTPTASSEALNPSQTTVVSSLDLNARAQTDYKGLDSFEHDSLLSLEVTPKPATQRNFSIDSFHLTQTSLPDGSTTLMSKLHNALSLNMKLWPLQTLDSLRTPLVLVHDGSGLAVSYSRIANLGRKLYGINNPRFLTCQTWSNVTQMAESYANAIQEQLCGPVIVGGWSFGGVVAFELAKVLQARSCLVKGVILVDSPNPFNRVVGNPELVNCVVSAVRNLDPQVQQLYKFQFLTNTQLLAEYNPYSLKLLDTIPMVLLRSKEGFNPPNVSNVPAWLSDRSCASSHISGWTTLSGRSVPTIDIPGNHFTAFDSHNVEETSKCIREACEILEGNNLIHTTDQPELVAV